VSAKLWFAALAAIAAPTLAHAEGRILVLSEQDERAYRDAFAAADRRDWQAADSALAQTRDGALAGAVQAARFLSGSYDPSFAELNAWLAVNADSAVADQIYTMATTRRGPGDPAPPTPIPLGRRPLPGAGGTPPGDSAQARAQVDLAAQQFADGDLGGAQNAAAAAAGGPRMGQGEFYLGLILFRQQNYRDAAIHFDAATTWRFWDAGGAASAFYWAGRAHLAAGEAKPALTQFKAALRYPATFYGQLAEAQLGRQTGLTFTPPTITSDDALLFMQRHPEARRAAGLAQVGRLSDVEQELRVLHTRLSAGEDRVFLDFADALAAPSAQLRAAEYGDANQAWGHCPTTTFAPDNGWRLDRALVYAVARQESRYSPVAVSRSNARGLMQLLPSTAQDMDKSGPNYRLRPDLLSEPGVNLRLGQGYLEWLEAQAAPDGDLIKLFAAYNGGPGWLNRWLAGANLSDPLLILESLPRTESRDYAERVMGYMGLCRRRFGQEPVEFDLLASGRPARYTQQDR
jgi:soluble lytic murein transglycosylase-like protein